MRRLRIRIAVATACAMALAWPAAAATAAASSSSRHSDDSTLRTQRSSALPSVAASPLPLLLASFLVDAAAAQQEAPTSVQPVTPPDAAAETSPASPSQTDRSDVSTRSDANLPSQSEDGTLKPDAAQDAKSGIPPSNPTEPPVGSAPIPTAAPTNDAPTPTGADSPPTTAAGDASPAPITPATETPASTPTEGTSSPPPSDSNPAPSTEPAPTTDEGASNPPAGNRDHDRSDTSSDDTSSDDSSSQEDSNWSLHFLRHCTLVTSILLICIGSTVWLAGIKLFRYSPPLCCGLMLTLWAFVSCNAVVAAWTAEASSPASFPDGAPVLPGDRDGWGLDLGTASGAATFAALLGAVGGIAFLAWIMACSKAGAYYAPKIVAAVWGILLGSIVHTGGIAWLLDTSTPETLAWTMHGSLLLSCLCCCGLTLLHMQHDDRSGLIAATSGCGSWSLVRGLVMLILFLETSAESHHQGKEMDRSWKWPNEWNLPLIDEAHPSRVSSFDALASDPSYASSVPYSSLASSVTQDEIVMNVNASYYFYLALISILFIVGASIQSIRPRSSRQLLTPFLDSKQSSRRGSAHALLGGGSGGSGGGSGRKLSGGSLPSASSIYRGSSYSEGYGALGSSTPNSAHGHAHGSGRSKSAAPAYYHRRPASDDLHVGSSTAWDRHESHGDGSAGGGRGGPDLERGLPVAGGSSRSMTTSPLKASKTPSRGINKSGTASSDWSRRTSFSLAIDVPAEARHPSGRGKHTNGSNVSRSPSAPVLSAMDAAAVPSGAAAAAGVTDTDETTEYLLSPILTSDAPVSDFAPKQLVVRGSSTATAPVLGGVNGSLRRMQQVASALKADKHRLAHTHKKSISFMTEFGVVQPQRTPEPPATQDPASADWVLQQAPDSISPPLQQLPRDLSAPATLLAMHPSGSLEASPHSGTSQATPITPAWSPYPLVTREDLEAEADRMAAAATTRERQSS